MNLQDITIRITDDGAEWPPYTYYKRMGGKVTTEIVGLNGYNYTNYNLTKDDIQYFCIYTILHWKSDIFLSTELKLIPTR